MVPLYMADSSSTKTVLEVVVWLAEKNKRVGAESIR